MNPPQVVFIPQPDITALELAAIVKLCQGPTQSTFPSGIIPPKVARHLVSTSESQEALGKSIDEFLKNIGATPAPTEKPARNKQR